MALAAKNSHSSVSLTNDRFIGPVVKVSCNGEEVDLFLCCGEWVEFSECEDSCPRFWRCDNIAQVNMVGSEDYKDEV